MTTPSPKVDAHEAAPLAAAGMGRPIPQPDALPTGNPPEGAFSPGAPTLPSTVHSPCVDLAGVYDSRFKIRKEAAGVTWFETPELERIWLLELPCRFGTIHPHGGAILAATITSRRIGNLVATLPCIRSSRGDIERVVTFHINDADAVLDSLRPYRRRQISAEERARLVAIGRRHRFAGAQAPKTGLESTRASNDDLEGPQGLEVRLADAEVVPTEETGARRSYPADECDAFGADQFVVDQRRVSAPHGAKARR